MKWAKNGSHLIILSGFLFPNVFPNEVGPETDPTYGLPPPPGLSKAVYLFEVK
jgi:hypothetical protein